jgi:hypothetical protein
MGGNTGMNGGKGAENSVFIGKHCAADVDSSIFFLQKYTSKRNNNQETERKVLTGSDRGEARIPAQQERPVSGAPVSGAPVSACRCADHAW